MDDAMTHFAAGSAVVYFLQYLKSTRLCSFIRVDTPTLNRLLFGIAAAVLAVGINWSGSADAGWTIHIPPVTVLVTAGWEWMKQFAVQQILYDGVVQRSGQPLPRPV